MSVQKVKLNDTMIVWGSRLIRAMGVNAALGSPKSASIFMLHSVLPNFDRTLSFSEHTSASFLERVLNFYRNRGFEFVSISEALSRLSDQEDMRNFIVFTFDDGYKNNLTSVLPLFAKYQCPFVVFVTTDMVERHASYWWAGLQEVLKYSDTIDYEPMGCRISVRTLSEKRAAYAHISSHVRDGASRPADILALMSRHAIDSPTLLERDVLSRGELKQLAEAPLVTIGGHTRTHCALSQVKLDIAKDEIDSNRRYLEDVGQKQVRHFAYPFGDERSCGPREYDLVRNLGFSSAVTTRRGNLHHIDYEDRFSLPRVLFSGVRESISYLELQRCGTMNLIRSTNDPKERAL